MKTKIKKIGDTIVVSMDGRLDFEANEPLKQDLSDLLRKKSGASKTDSVPSKIIFNLEKLEFVGSSGISSFIQTLREFGSRAPVKPKYCHVGTEFRKVMKAFAEDVFEFYDDEDHAKKSYDQ